MKHITLHVKRSPQKDQMKSHTRVHISAGELITRIALGKQLLEVYSTFSRKEWGNYIKTLNINASSAQTYMRVARRFGTQEQTQRLLMLKLPYTVIESVASDQISDEMVEAFFLRIGNVVPTIEHCQRVLDEVQRELQPSFQQTVLESEEQGHLEEQDSSSLGREALVHEDAPRDFPALLLQMANAYRLWAEQLEQYVRGSLSPAKESLASSGDPAEALV